MLAGLVPTSRRDAQADTKPGEPVPENANIDCGRQAVAGR